MNELEEAQARKTFSEAVARYRRATAQAGANFSAVWLAAMEAAKQARALSDYWEEQATAWVGRASGAVPDDDEPDEPLIEEDPAERERPPAREGPDEPITMKRAAAIAGLAAAASLTHAAQRGALEATKSGHDWLTTRRALHRYLAGRRRGVRVPLPDGYQVPEGEEPIPS